MASFGRYSLVRKVGTGGMAEIWKAKAQGPAGFEKVLAIKKVLSHLVEDGEFIEMFIAEAKLVAGLVHPNIVQVFDFGQVGEKDYFIAMEYVAGANLAMILRRIAQRGARLPIEVGMYVVIEACKGLGYAHSKGDLAGNPLNIVHRDVSPQNILVSFSGEVKVTDFGIAKVESALTHTAAGHVRGKLAYMSPEQANVKPLDNRSDLFALGVVLYELVTGNRLFAGNSGSEIFAKVSTFKLPAAEELEGIPHEVREILQSALAAEPDDRYSDAMEMEHALNAALGPEGIVQARHALASIVQRIFDDERQLEMTPDPGPEPEPIAAQQRVSGEQAALAQTAVSDPRLDVPLRPTPTPSPSGLTLAPSTVRPVTGPEELPQAHKPATGDSAGRGRGMRAGVWVFGVAVAAGALVLAAMAGGRFLGAAAPLTGQLDPKPQASAVVTRNPDFAPSGDASPAGAGLAGKTPPPTAALPTATHAVVEVAPTPPPRAASEFAYVTVNARPWVQVFVDGRSVTSETPLRRFKVPAGRRTLKFVNPGLEYSYQRTYNLPGDAELKIFVDVPRRSVSYQ